MKIYYLEIVANDVDAVCELYSQTHNVTFGEGDANLGGARTAKLEGGELLGVRAPMSETEEPIVRPYALVPDIQAAVETAAAAGAEIALPPMEIKTHGTCAIVIQGGSQVCFWQV